MYSAILLIFAVIFRAYGKDNTGGCCVQYKSISIDAIAIIVNNGIIDSTILPLYCVITIIYFKRFTPRTHD